MGIKTFLAMMVKHDASDLYFSAEAPPAIKIEGKTRATHCDRQKIVITAEKRYPLRSKSIQRNLLKGTSPSATYRRPAVPRRNRVL